MIMEIIGVFFFITWLFGIGVLVFLIGRLFYDATIDRLLKWKRKV